MRPQLKRIESALARIDQSSQTRSIQSPATRRPRPSSSPPSPSPSSQPSNPKTRRESPSFTFTLNPSRTRKSPPSRPSPPSPPQPYQNNLSTLNQLKSAQISTHRHSVNPALATNILKEIEEVIVGWQKELKQILIKIQDLYLEGPIVDGWLESQTADGTKRLPQEAHTVQPAWDGPGPRPGYRLCGLDDQGRLWSKPCPPEQVASVSVAIARYQKLRQLLKQKQLLENRLSRIAETLVMVHGSLHDQ
ncbi:hypothetical protein PN462_08835 [Spirulina sp. CS-785/01]|uniref:hypothetical protein n=1 Tax=Spirulina sp. CS-785/01 TaxID=3021716 RepID=UPI00232D652B|nr:hypothetical protein [Spirulina sp. CS-785/01]MDB9313204.1 hypothetical protein [Spirulina sp. CS-785/01]